MGQGRDAAPPMWQTAQEGYNDGSDQQHQQQRALAIASSTSNAAAAAPPATSSSSCSPEDAAFADVLAVTMQGHLSPAEAVREYALICERAADAGIRHELPQQLSQADEALASSSLWPTAGGGRGSGGGGGEAAAPLALDA